MIGWGTGVGITTIDDHCWISPLGADVAYWTMDDRGAVDGRVVDDYRVADDVRGAAPDRRSPPLNRAQAAQIPAPLQTATCD
jgi:hypothetical protein